MINSRIKNNGKRNKRYASSVVEFLYPYSNVVETPAIPYLSLPLSVGIAFVPESGAGPMIKRLSRKEKRSRNPMS